MPRRPLRGIRMIDCRRKPDCKSDPIESPRGNIVQGKTRPPIARADAGKLISGLDPCLAGALQGEARQNKIQSSDRNFLSGGCLIFERIKNQRRAVEARLNVYFQICALRHSARAKNENRDYNSAPYVHGLTVKPSDCT